MGMFCSCLCNQAGHADRCLGIAEPGLGLPKGAPRTCLAGFVCRPCYEAVVTQLRYGRDVAQRRSEYGNALTRFNRA